MLNIRKYQVFLVLNKGEKYLVSVSTITQLNFRKVLIPKEIFRYAEMLV